MSNVSASSITAVQCIALLCVRNCPLPVALQLDIPADCSVRQLAALLGSPAARLEAWLRDTLQERPASIEDAVSYEAAELAALEWGRTPVMDSWAAAGECDVLWCDVM
jgi:hypothetical protein